MKKEEKRNIYHESKIYKIVSTKTKNVYIGSTTNKYLCNRFGQHAFEYRKWTNGDKKYRYVTSFDILKFDDAEIILVEKFPCESKDELTARERYWIDNTPNCINKIKPTRTPQQYYEDKRAIILQRQKEYQRKNKEAIALNAKTKINCECGSAYTKSNRNKHVKTECHLNYLQEYIPTKPLF